MNFHELVKHRYSVRSYKSQPVEENKLEKILEAARFAPTAANFQAFRLIVIKTEHNKQGLRRIYDRDWFVQAPILICACGIPSKSWVRKDGKNYNDVDVAIVMDHLILAATEEGLGTCWIGAFDPIAAKEVLALPKEFEPVAFTPLGYPNDQPNDKKRKSMAEIVNYVE
ncbi:MAG: nitroreductase family protein [bacterium]|nr:nitroreductase family protein [bacterium]